MSSWLLRFITFFLSFQNLNCSILVSLIVANVLVSMYNVYTLEFNLWWKRPIREELARMRYLWRPCTCEPPLCDAWERRRNHLIDGMLEFDWFPSLGNSGMRYLLLNLMFYLCIGKLARFRLLLSTSECRAPIYSFKSRCLFHSLGTQYPFILL